MSVVRLWKDDAYSTLQKAQEMSSQAQASLDATHHFLAVDSFTKTQHVLANVALVHSKQKECQAILAKLQTQFSNLRARYNNDLDAKLRPSLKKLEDVQARLATVEVPSFLLRLPKKQLVLQHLDDFISTDEIDHLRKNMALYQNNCAAFLALLESEFAAANTAWLELSKEYSSFVSIQEVPVYELQQLQKFLQDLDHHETRAPRKNDSKIVSSVESILDQNNAMSHELVNLLQMLTNHYDQCTSALSWIQGNPLQTTDLAVLENDTRELPSVLREISSIQEILLTNKRSLAYTIEPRGYDLMIDKCDRLTHALAEFQSKVLTKVTLLMAHFSSHYSHSFLGPSSLHPQETPMASFSQVLDLLSDHYQQFCSVYHVQYLSELYYEQYVYPRKFLKLIDEFFNDKLLSFEDAERERRLAWLRRYGEFIPSSFQLPGDSVYPSVVQVVSDGLDDLNSETAESDEARLLELLKAPANTSL